MARKGKLTDEMRAFVVREIAGFSTPGQIAEMVNERFGVQISPQAVEKYDPEKNKKLSAKWAEHFKVMRAAWREKTEDMIPLANKFVRLRELTKLARRMEKNPLGQAQLIEQIAKEVGNVHSNKREWTGKDGGPMQFEDVSAMTPEQVSDELRELTKDPAVRAMLAGMMMGNEEAAPIPAPQVEEKPSGKVQKQTRR